MQRDGVVVRQCHCPAGRRSDSLMDSSASANSCHRNLQSIFSPDLLTFGYSHRPFICPWNCASLEASLYVSVG